MKSRNIIIASVTAGLAVAGLVTYFFFTQKGKETRKKWQQKGKDLADKAKDKFVNRKENIPGSERVMPEPFIQEMFE